MTVENANTISSTLKMESQVPVMSKTRILKNLIVVCLGYFFLFCAYQGLANLQSSLNIEGNLGVLSQSVLYVTMILSSLLLPKLVIRKFGCKATLVMSSLLYAPYIAVNFYPSMATFLSTAIVVGIAAPALWSAKCTYLNEISALYASQSKDSANVVTSRFFGIFFMIFQCTQIVGNLVSFFVLRPSTNGTNEASTGLAYQDANITCGVDFCTAINENLKPSEEDKKNILIGIYLLFVGLAALTLGLFLDSYKTKKVDDYESVPSRVLATLKHLKKPKQILLLPLTVFSGLEQGFILGDFTQGYVACAWGTYHVGLVFIFFGIVDSIVSFISGRLVKYIPRWVIMVTAALGNLGVCIALFLWQPNSEQYAVFFVLAGVWGLSDGIWQTLLNALYGSLFRCEEEAAYANYRLWESLGFAIAFACSSVLCIAPKLYILLSVLLLGMSGYLAVEITLFFEKKS